MSRVADPFALAGRAVPGLDGLRGLACLMVFNVHYFAQFADSHYFVQPGGALHAFLRVLHSGSHGVDIFFVVSGFLIYTSLTRKTPTFTRFLLERYKRLLPVVLAVNVPALVWINADAKTFVDNILFLDLFGSRLVTFVAWALVYEMYFYLLCGLWLILLPRDRRSPPWASFTLLCLLFTANSLWLRVNPVLSDWRFAGFFVGVGLAMLRDDPRGRPLLARLPSWTWLPCTGAIALGCWLWSRDALGTLAALSPALGLAYFMAFDVAVALLLAILAQEGDRDRSPYSRTGPRILGAVSYSLFMLHTQWGLPLANNLFGVPDSLAALAAHYALTLTLSFAMAALLFCHLERAYFTKPRHATP